MRGHERLPCNSIPFSLEIALSYGISKTTLLSLALTYLCFPFPYKIIRILLRMNMFQKCPHCLSVTLPSRIGTREFIQNFSHDILKEAEEKGKKSILKWFCFKKVRQKCKALNFFNKEVSKCFLNSEMFVGEELLSKTLH